MNQTFIHLHVHSEYSVVDGIVRIKDLINSAINYNMPAVALTDQSNLFAMVKFFKEAVSKGIKPIFGLDVWVENDLINIEEGEFKIILLCQDKTGYHNLSVLLSRAYLENQKFDNKPIIKLSWLKEFNESLIAISHPANSDLNYLVKKEKFDSLKTRIEFWGEIFFDRFYIGLSKINRSGEINYINNILPCAEITNIPVVALNEVCFLKSEDFEAHEARVCIRDGVVLDDPRREIRYTHEQYFKSSDEICKLFQDIPEAITNTVEIYKRCNLILELGKVFLPNFPIPKNMTLKEYFNKKAYLGLEKRLKELFKVNNLEEIKDKTKKYYERLQIELDVINKMGFAGYFLIVADFISWAKENKIPVGPGRGSGAGSLVAYALLITNLDPLQYDLLFERFLNPERVSMPDFDIDFCMEGRDEVINYVANKYGKEAVSQIITYGTMAAKAVVRDVGRVLGHPYGFVDKIAKLIPMELGITLDKALEDEALSEIYNNEEEVKNLVDLAKKLEGVTRNVGKHAGGVVIAPSKLTDFTPIYCEAGEQQLVSQFDKNDIEEIGLVKFDFLGLRTLTIINWAVNSINKIKQEKGEELFDINDIPLEDQKTFDLLCECKTTAVFQLESRGMKDLIRRLKPDRFEDIVALVALFRPGPLQSGMVDDFIDRKLGRAKIEYPHPDLEPILNSTYGVILYQEQVMQIAQVLAGYTLGAADLLRRAMGKKKPEEMAKQRTIFTTGAVERGVEEEVATYIFDLMEKFAGYGFNKSHSAAYALISYQTAWLKAHYPAQFMAAVMSSDMANTDKVVMFIEDAKALGLKVIPPNINQSVYKFSVNNNMEIVYGLGAIKGVGEAAIGNIIEERNKNGDFKDLFDFCCRVDLRKVTKRVTESLIKSGAFDYITNHRAYLTAIIESAAKAAEQYHKNAKEGQFDLFGAEDNINANIENEININASSIKYWSDKVRLYGEKETLGLYLTGHPINEYEQELRSYNCIKIVNLRAERGVKKRISGLIIAIRTMITKRGDKMAFITLDDNTGRQEVAVFSDLYLEIRDKLKKDEIVLVEGEVGHDDFSGGLRVRVDQFLLLEEAKAKFAKCIYIKLINNKNNQNTKNIIRQLHELLSNYTTNINNKNGLKGIPVWLKYILNEIEANIKFSDEWCVYPNLTMLNKLNSISEELIAEFCYN